MKNINLYILFLSLLAFNSCNKSEKDLLKSKVYFEKEQIIIEIDNIDTYDYNLVSRVSSLVNEDVDIEYELADKSLVDTYNQRHGTKYGCLPAQNIAFENNKSTIKSGSLYSGPCKITLKNLGTVKEGNTFLVPIKIKNSKLSSIQSSAKIFMVIKKPIVIKKVYDFNGKYLSIPMPTNAKFKSVTYEALIYADYFAWISTILGREGTLMFRFGDTTIDKDQIQIAGGIQFNAIPNFQTKKWYHVAFVFDGNTKKAEIYINGEKVADKTADVSSIDLTKEFFIGYAYDFDPRRTWHGKMSECRIWNIARSAAKIRENMLGVDPQSEGLFGYWKLNGEDYYEKEGRFFVKDQTKNSLDAVSRKGAFKGGAGVSLKPTVVNLKVDLK